MQTAGGLVGLAREFAARMERAEDHLERGFVGEFRVRVDRDAAPVIADGDGVIGVKFHFDPVGMARNGLVHGIVQHLGYKVVQRSLVRAPDKHSGSFADGFKPFEDLDGGCVVVVG